MGAWAVPRRYLPLPMHQRRRLLAAVACYQAARATNTFHRLPSHRRCCMHGCMKRLAQVRHPQTDPHQWVLGPCPGGTSRCPCINGGACLRRWRVIKVAARATTIPSLPSTLDGVATMGCMKRLAQGVIRRRIRTNGCLGRAQEVPPAAHASTEALAGGGGVLSSRTCNQYIPSLALSHRRCCMHGCMKRLAQGVIRRRIRTNGCLGRAQEVPPAAHASTEALACGGGVLSSRTCNHNSILALSHWRCCMDRLHEAPCSGRHPQTDPHQWVLGPCPGGTSRCPCINGGACWRRWRVIKPHVQPVHPSLALTSTVLHAWLHEAPCSERHLQTHRHQWVLGPCPGGASRCPCINGGACWQKYNCLHDQCNTRRHAVLVRNVRSGCC